MSKWTDERVDLLKQLWGEGKTAKEIAQILGGGLTRNAVIGKAHRMKLSGRVSPIQQNKTVQQEKAENQARAQGKLVNAKNASKPSKPVRSPANAKAPVNPPVKRKPVPAAANEAQGEPTQLVDIKEKMCRWPVGDPKDDDFHFCGADAEQGLPYCDVHADIAYNVNVRNKSIHIAENSGKNRRDEADELLSSMANAS